MTSTSSINEPPFRCPVCDSRITGPIVAREMTSGGEVMIRQCPSCGLHITWPRLPDSQEGYVQFTLDSWTAKYGAIDKGERLHDRHQNYLEEVSAIKEFVPNGRILDVGCNAGWLLGYLQKSGVPYQLEGLEPSTTLAEIAHRRLNVPIHNQFLQELTGQQYDALIATDVIEHITPEEINGFLKAAHDLLKPGGYIFLKTPNVRFTTLKSRIVHLLPQAIRRFVLKAEDVWDAKEHLILWDATTLNRILDQHGLKPVKTLVPLPVQTRNSPRIAYLLRSTLYRLAKLFSRNNSVPAFAQDIFVIARKS